MKYIFLLIALLFFASCEEKQKTVTVSKELVIVSDYLDDEDTNLFVNYCRVNHVNLKIINMSADRIIGHFRNRHYDSGVDVIMLRSLYDVNRLSRNDLFHPIDQIIAPDQFQNMLNSNEYDYIGIGINPYILSYPSGQSNVLKTYNELREKPFCSNLNKYQLTPLFAGIMPSHHKVGTYNWVEDYGINEAGVNQFNDSIGRNTCLTMYDLHFSSASDSAYSANFDKIQFPNQNGKGMFYDLYSVAVVRQAENFTTAKEFVHHFLDPKSNEALCTKLNVLSLNQQKKVRLTRYNPAELIQYYVLVERMLTKLHAVI